METGRRRLEDRGQRGRGPSSREGAAKDGVSGLFGGGAGALVAGVLVAAGCSGGGGGQPPIALQFTATSAELPEDGSSIGLDVRLDLTEGPLEDAVTVRVVDMLSGSATSELDYILVAQTLVFPADSADGATQEVSIASVSDSDAEGDETVVLSLTDVTGGAVLGSASVATVTIADDDVPGTLEVTSDDGTGELPLAAGDVLDFGSLPDGGAESEILVYLENGGDSSITLSAVTLGATEDFTVVVDAAGQPAPAALPAAPEQRSSPLVPLGEDSELGLSVVLDGARADELAQLSSVLLEGVALPGGVVVDLALERLPSPFPPQAVVALNGAPAGHPDDLTPGLSLWKGAVAGREGSAVYLALSPLGTRGWIRLSESPADTVYLTAETSTATTPGGAQSRFALPEQMQNLGDQGPGDFCAGAPRAPGGGPPEPAPETAQMPAGDTLSPSLCRVAFETDYQFMQLFGGDPSAATTYVAQLIGAVNDAYLESVQANLQAVYISLWPVPGPTDDPWETSDVPGTPEDLLAEFEQEWAPIKGGTLAPSDVGYDVAHFLSGADIQGGIAYVDVLCNANFGFGVSGSLLGSVDWSSFTGQPDAMNWDFVVVAHEIGHNFDALHTHDYCPPLDRCVASAPEQECDFGKVCGSGTLMSYCHLCPPGTKNIVLDFHPTVANFMRQAVNQSCLPQSTLPGGAGFSLRARFAPQSGAGVKQTTLRFTHDAPNQPSPFEVTLTGESVP